MTQGQRSTMGTSQPRMEKRQLAAGRKLLLLLKRPNQTKVKKTAVPTQGQHIKRWWKRMEERRRRR
ncbi:unnamed protein product, partial [Gadus morhua 'NCC']